MFVLRIATAAALVLASAYGHADASAPADYVMSYGVAGAQGFAGAPARAPAMPDYVTDYGVVGAQGLATAAPHATSMPNYVDEYGAVAERVAASVSRAPSVAGYSGDAGAATRATN